MQLLRSRMDVHRLGVLHCCSRERLIIMYENEIWAESIKRSACADCSLYILLKNKNSLIKSRDGIKRKETR